MCALQNSMLVNLTVDESRFKSVNKDVFEIFLRVCAMLFCGGINFMLVAQQSQFALS